jgi:D-galactose 1-dehydrogenase
LALGFSTFIYMINRVDWPPSHIIWEKRVSPVRIGILGVGKIATDQHIPVLSGNGDFRLCAAASRHNQVAGIDNFTSLEAILDGTALDAVAICTPPQQHFQAAMLALSRGKHVLLEKPPCATTIQLDQLSTHAAATGATLFASWHSRFAPAVEPARRLLAERKIQGVRITWKEDVRRWHPGQTWIWQAGGFGVFDPGINAISILTAILPERLFVERADLFIPDNCDAPIAADMRLRTPSGTPVDCAFDFRHTGEQTWDIEVETDRERIALSSGGATIRIDSGDIRTFRSDPHAEYAPLYRRFADLVRAGKSDVDATPFRLVADAFLIGRRIAVEAFHE